MLDEVSVSKSGFVFVRKLSMAKVTDVLVNSDGHPYARFPENVHYISDR